MWFPGVIRVQGHGWCLWHGFGVCIDEVYQKIDVLDGKASMIRAHDRIEAIAVVIVSFMMIPV
jgi:hypothetical protein